MALCAMGCVANDDMDQGFSRLFSFDDINNQSDFGSLSSSRRILRSKDQTGVIYHKILINLGGRLFSSVTWSNRVSFTKLVSLSIWLLERWSGHPEG